MWAVLETGLLLSLILLLISLNFMLIDVASETYHDAKLFINAIQAEISLGVGDLKVLQILKRTMPKLANYYLFLSVFFFIFAAILNYIMVFIFMAVLLVYWSNYRS